MTEYEVRYTPDGFPLGIFGKLQAAVNFAAKRADRLGKGPYLIYEIHPTSGERYLGEAG